MERGQGSIAGWLQTGELTRRSILLFVSPFLYASCGVFYNEDAHVNVLSSQSVDPSKQPMLDGLKHYVNRKMRITLTVTPRLVCLLVVHVTVPLGYP